jgi:hypothetical protein
VEVKFHSSLASVLLGGEGSTSGARCFISSKNPVLIEQEAGWAPEMLWTFGRRKSLLLLMRFKPWIVWSTAVTIQILPSHSLPLQVIHGYIEKVPAEMDYISFKIICQFYFG